MLHLNSPTGHLRCVNKYKNKQRTGTVQHKQQSSHMQCMLGTVVQLPAPQTALLTIKVNVLNSASS